MAEFHNQVLHSLQKLDVHKSGMLSYDALETFMIQSHPYFTREKVAATIHAAPEAVRAPGGQIRYEVLMEFLFKQSVKDDTLRCTQSDIVGLLANSGQPCASEVRHSPLEHVIGQLRSLCMENEMQVLPYSVEDGVASIFLGGAESDESTTPWGTSRAEHRLNPFSALALIEALRNAEQDETVSAVVLGAHGKYFCNGFDLKWIQANPEHADLLQLSTEVLCSYILQFPKPTIAAINGHCTAAGAMLVLSFDERIMNNEKGYFFVPGIDLGLTYSAGMSELMRCKLPAALHSSIIVFGERYTALTLGPHGVVSCAMASEVLPRALERARQLRPKAKHSEAMRHIKATLYHEAIAALQVTPDPIVHSPQFMPMGFDVIPVGKDRPASSQAAQPRQSPTAADALRPSVNETFAPPTLVRESSLKSRAETVRALVRIASTT